MRLKERMQDFLGKSWKKKIEVLQDPQLLLRGSFCGM
jgi:hypothetical protein